MTTLTATTSTTTITGDTTGTLVFNVGSGPTTALTLNTDQTATFTSPLVSTGTNPHNIAAGTLKTSPTAGDVEYDGGVFYATPTTGQRAVVQTLAQGISASTYNGPINTTYVKLVNSGTNGALYVVAGYIYLFEVVLVSTVNGGGTNSRTPQFVLVNSAVSGAATLTFSPFVMNSTLYPAATINVAPYWNVNQQQAYSQGSPTGGASGNANFTTASVSSVNTLAMYGRGIFQVSTSGYFSPAYALTNTVSVAYQNRPGTFFTVTPLGYSASTSLTIGSWA